MSENGMAIVTEFENHIGTDMFLITDSITETYQKLLDFNESIYDEGSIIDEYVLFFHDTAVNSGL